MLAVAVVDSENGMPKAAAARATAISPPRQPKPTAPVGAMAIGNVAIYLVGVPWLMAVRNLDLATGITQGLTPFLLGDAIKLLLASAAFPAAGWIVGRRAGEG